MIMIYNDILPCCWSQQWSDTRTVLRHFSERPSVATCMLLRPCRIAEQTWWCWWWWFYKLFICLFSHLAFYIPVISDDERGSGGERYWLVVCLCTRCKRILRGDKFDDYLVRKWVFLGRGWRISVGMWIWLNYMDTAMAVDVNIWKWERVCTGIYGNGKGYVQGTCA